jgi:peptidoglycan hydrolase-like protein with peptidoglycan-binding domain
MLLRLHDSGDAVKALQRGLNKLGSILLIDGDFGPATRDAVVDARTALGRPGPPEADDGLQQALLARADPFPPLTAAGVTFIARAEVSGPQEYRRLYRRPTWPSAGSGITIGIGYDLQFVSRDQLAADWQNQLPAEAIARLAEAVGRVGSPALLDRVRDVDVPLPGAFSAFIERLLPAFLQQTRSVYPQVDGLPPERRTALVSLVYNRGPGLQDRDPAREDRREMRAIRDLLDAGRTDAVSDQIDAMARLWDPVKVPGLIKRRHDEARLWRASFAALQLD